MFAYPLRRPKQLDQGFANIPTTSPGLRLISSPFDAHLPCVGVHRELSRNRTHIGLILRNEVVHEPAVVEERPFNTDRFFKDFAEWGSRRTV